MFKYSFVYLKIVNDTQFICIYFNSENINFVVAVAVVVAVAFDASVAVEVSVSLLL